MKQLILILFTFIFFAACMKDDPPPAPEEVKPSKVETRTGQPETIYYDRSGVKASTDYADTVAVVFNLRHVDSTSYHGNWLAPFTRDQNVDCMKYYMDFYHDGNVFYQCHDFAPFHGIDYSTIYSDNEGWDSNILYYVVTRKNNDFVVGFDEECLKWKLNYRYQKRIFYVDGHPPDVVNEYVRSSHCTRNYVLYPRKFRS